MKNHKTVIGRLTNRLKKLISNDLKLSLMYFVTIIYLSIYAKNVSLKRLKVLLIMIFLRLYMLIFTPVGCPSFGHNPNETLIYLYDILALKIYENLLGENSVHTIVKKKIIMIIKVRLRWRNVTSLHVKP